MPPHPCLHVDAGSLALVGGVPPRCLFVAQQQRGFTRAFPLYTHGAGVCLGVVVHEKRTGHGALAHIGLPSLGDWGRNKDYCIKQIKSMMDTLRTRWGAEQSWQVFLYGSANALADHPRGDIGFSRRLAAELQGAEVEDHLGYAPLAGGYGPAPAQILYWPERGVVAELDDGELRSVKAHQVDGVMWGAAVEAYPDQPA